MIPVRLASAATLPTLLAACGPQPGNVARSDENGTVVAAQAPEVAKAVAPSDWSQVTRGATSMVRTAGGWAPALFLCDGTDQPAVYALTLPGADGVATLVGRAKSGRVLAERRVVIGAGDAGAGQIRYPMEENGEVIGDVHLLNEGVLDDATTPTVSSITVAGARVRCRWQPNTRAQAVTDRRGVLVTGVADGPLTYRSFDHQEASAQRPRDDGRTTLATRTVTGGTGEGSVFRFRTGATDYILRVSADPARPGGTLDVERAGRQVQSEALFAYTLAGKGAYVPDSARASFRCDPAPDMSVMFDNLRDVATLRFPDGRTVELAGQRPASGIWYRGEGWELRGKGREATLGGPTGTQRCRSDG